MALISALLHAEAIDLQTNASNMRYADEMVGKIMNNENRSIEENRLIAAKYESLFEDTRATAYKRATRLGNLIHFAEQRLKLDFGTDTDEPNNLEGENPEMENSRG